MIMKNAFIASSLFLCTPIVMAAMLPYPEVEEALKQAENSNKPALILWYGSDWTYQVKKLCHTWSRLSPLKSQVVLGQFDSRTGGNKNPKLPINTQSLPVAVMVAPDGTLMRMLPEKLVRSSAKEIASEVKETAKIAHKFVDLVKKAQHAKGIPAAEAAGQALDLLPLSDALLNGKLKKIIETNDPEDSTGYKSLYATHYLGMYAQIKNRLQGGAEGGLRGKERKFSEALAYVNKALSNNKLKGEMLQQWYCGLGYVLKEQALSAETPNWQPVVDAYQKAIDVDPNSQYGIGAAKVKRYWDPNSYYEFTENFFGSGDQNVHMEKEWRVDVSKLINGAGTYTFSFDFDGRNTMRTRKFALFVNGNQVDALRDPEEITDQAELKVPNVSATDKVEVRFLSRCTDGWFGGTGCFVMKKNKG